jgi:hypothetical protein
MTLQIVLSPQQSMKRRQFECMVNVYNRRMLINKLRESSVFAIEVREKMWEDEICVHWPEKITRWMIIGLDNKLFIWGSLWIREPTWDEELDAYENAMKRCYSLDDLSFVKFVPISEEEFRRRKEYQERQREYLSYVLTIILEEMLFIGKTEGDTS